MIRGLLDIITGRAERRTRVQLATLNEPLRRFSETESGGRFRCFKSIARALARQTADFAESLVSDDAIPDWASLLESATPQQLADLGIFCSHCLVQFTLQGVKGQSALARLDAAGLRGDLSELVRIMYGTFATTSPLGAVTFDESLQMRDLEDDIEIRDLTKLLDQLMGLETFDNSHRDVKVRKLKALFSVHRRALEYRLHVIL
jgi:hypothetical protein